jgi:hypothetical protein
MAKERYGGGSVAAEGQEVYQPADYQSATSRV